MKLNLKTILSLIITLVTLLAGYATGYLQTHPDIAAVLAAVFTSLGHVLPQAAIAAAPKPAEGKPDVRL